MSNAWDNWKDGVDAANKAERDRRARDAEILRRGTSETLKIHEAARKRTQSSQQTPSGGNVAGGSNYGPSSGPSKSAGCLFLFLILLFGAGVLVWATLHEMTPNSTADKNSATQSDQAPANLQPGPHAKPSPGALEHPANPSAYGSQARPINPMSNAPANPLESASPQNPSASPFTNPITPTYFRNFAASRDGMSNGCSKGSLVFAAASMTFTCASDPAKNVTVRVNDVAGIDKNGIVTRSNQKFHFRISGMPKEQVAPAFSEWLRNANPSAAPSRN